MATWIKAEVIENRRWNKDLFSLTLDADVDAFTAGQFAKLGLEIDGKLVQRAYSYVNAPSSKHLEIYATRVADGLLSPRLHELEAGDTVMITKDAAGFFTLDEIPQGEHLWMLSTGTALGPFLSILQEDHVWQRFRKVVLVHAVRFSADLSYQAEINALKKKYSDQLIVQPFVSREPKAGALSGRITHALEDGMLERVVGFPLSAEQSQVMLCGNPQMVKDVKALLLEKGLQKNLRKKPGNITVEQYW
ncbi:ferredoxin--NADP reductase [Enterovibrio sp. ZSDZ35]|uniref:ferredoxin--NADP(+) reductase n=1 Tax=Enterovibrio qingdaonensis TaxID=2899818 RepID=A0ABT5QP64_9GAMM|nr:ferredoxin--NADP reductase [Enterovibrio sp. ZSDZ35]MDD1782086.1 ferredoxin--NADP reductase [Enterovibrio sp. ZSDZ35]